MTFLSPLLLTISYILLFLKNLGQYDLKLITFVDISRELDFGFFLYYVFVFYIFLV